jgi:AraC-like DNA-binding protein
MAGFGYRNTGRVDLRAVPHPAVTLVLDWGNGPLLVESGSGSQQHGALVAGLAPDAVRVQGENIECVQVRVSPAVAHAVLGVSPAELDHAVVGLDELWGRDATRIREQLGETRSWEGRFALTDVLLARRYEPRLSVDPEVAWTWDRIINSRGCVRIDELAVKIGWSRKRLWSRFRSQIGLSTKRAAKLVRFDHAAHRLAAGEPPARVAAEAGYADQSHLHRDVLAFSTVTPGTVADEPWLAVDDIAWGTFVQDQRR